MELRESFVLNAELYSPSRIRFDEIDELPRNDARLQFLNHGFHCNRWSHPFEQATDSPAQSNIDLGDFQTDSPVCLFRMKIDVIDPHDLSPVNIDDLLIEQVSF